MHLTDQYLLTKYILMIKIKMDLQILGDINIINILEKIIKIKGKYFKNYKIL